MNSTATAFAPVAATSGAPVSLAMQRLWLTGQVLPAGARLIVQHVFQSDEARPLEVIYSFPLPRDAALRRFRITGDGFEAHSELRETDEAVKAYEQGIADGSLSALARQYGDGIVNLTVGNIRPKETVTVHLELLAGVEMHDDGFRFRFPFTLSPAYHSKMRPAVTTGEGELELPAGEFGDLILPRFREDASSLHQVGFELSLPHQVPIDEIGSPSHSIRVRQGGSEPARVALAPEKDLPNRDLVLDVRFKSNQIQVLAGPAGDGKRSFAAVLPSTVFGQQPAEPRRVVFLLDRSGSMEGEKIAQARNAISACLGALAEQDSFLLVAFDDRVEPMHSTLVPATREQRDRARHYLEEIDARGGTELAAGVQHAAQVLGGAGDIVIITDGQVMGTEAILAQARGTGLRLFCLGIGSASQDRFLSLLARETGGVSRFVTASERVDLAAVDLFASVGRPVASALKASGVEPEPPWAVFAGTPVVLFGEMEGNSAERVDVSWNGGSLSFDVPPGNVGTGETVRLLRGSRLITDWESRYPAQEALAPLETRRQNRIAARLLELSRTFGLASREMSLVAVVKRSGDRPGELPETRVVPVGMPQDTAFRAYFPAAAPAFSLRSVAHLLSASGVAAATIKPRFMLSRSSESPGPRLDEFFTAPTGEDELIELAAELEPDGGLPGSALEIRAGRTVAAVLAFASGGHTLSKGAFRRHVARLVEFLKSLSLASESEARLIETALEAASTGKVPAGPWLALARERGTRWEDVESALSSDMRP